MSLLLTHVYVRMCTEAVSRVERLADNRELGSVMRIHFYQMEPEDTSINQAGFNKTPITHPRARRPYMDVLTRLTPDFPPCDAPIRFGPDGLLIYSHPEYGSRGRLTVVIDWHAGKTLGVSRLPVPVRIQHAPLAESAAYPA